MKKSNGQLLEEILAELKKINKRAEPVHRRIEVRIAGDGDEDSVAQAAARYIAMGRLANGGI